MIFKLKTMGGAEIPLENEEAVMKLLEQANAGAKLVFTKYGVVNVSSIDSIVPHKEKMESVREQVQYGTKREEAERDVLGNSPFAGKLLELAESKKMLK